MLLDPVWGRRAGHWLKFSTSNHVASVFTSRAHILPPVQGCPGPRSPAPTRAELRLRYSPRAPRHQACVAPGWLTPIIRSYQGESTGSHPNSEVKHPWACSVLRWGTTWESQVSYVFVFCRPRRPAPPPGTGRNHSARPASGCISGARPRTDSYLLGLLAKIKCSICSYQLNL